MEQVSSVKPSFMEASNLGPKSDIQTAGDVLDTTFGGRSQGISGTSSQYSSSQQGITGTSGMTGTESALAPASSTALQDTSGTRTVPQESYAHRYKSLGRYVAIIFILVTAYTSDGTVFTTCVIASACNSAKWKRHCT